MVQCSTYILQMRKVLIVCAYMSIAKSMNSEHIVHLVYSISVTVLDAQNIERYILMHMQRCIHIAG